MKMVVAIDTRWIFKELSGIGVYTKEIIKNIIALDKDNSYILIFDKLEVQAQIEKELDIENVENFKSINVGFGVFSIGNQLKFNNVLVKNNVDVYHSTNYMVPVLPRLGKASKIKYVVTIHDIIPMLFREHAPKSKKSRLFPVFKAIMKRVVNQADIILTVSNASKNDIETYFKIKPDTKVHAFHNACSDKFQPIPFDDKKDMQFLYVGRADPYKDIETIIKAVSIVAEKGYKNIQLVLAGSPDERYNAPQVLTEELGLISVRWTGYISDEELIKLYQESTALLHPSLYEGFGLQIIEAMQSGTPVISSVGGSLKEICGDAAIVLPVKSPELFAESIEKLLNSKELQKELIQKGFKRAKEFSWEKTTRNILSIY
ncbi:MAG: glycosyltransferase family 1 protein [Kiritimatiellae bacterium]|jgi:glycosyltransferase involved in cell wall biosynthesis|nr:glycosyltransferase family 1 protein [Kiritimatiellia bacterium]